MAEAIEQLVGPGAILGEGPVWDTRESVLWWVDIPGEILHRFDPGDGSDTPTSMGMGVGALAPRDAGGLLLATPRGFESYDPKTGEQAVLASVETAGLRMNDGKADSQGRFWGGTMAYDCAPNAGAFYRLDTDLTVTKMVDKTTISNGLAWTADDETLYYIDSTTQQVDAFDFDATAGTISNRRPVVTIAEETGLPDGMCIDSEGYLWVSLYQGGAVHRYSPESKLDGIIEVPANQVTCCAFGGPDWADLYITTAAQGFTDDDRKNDPEAGSLFRVRPGVTGPPVNTFAG